jgi:hypothetical protein
MYLNLDSGKQQKKPKIGFVKIVQPGFQIESGLLQFLA